MSAVDDFILGQPPPLQPLLRATRSFLHETAPGLREDIKWRIPTFMRERNLFYINPRPDHVVLGFCNGAELAEHHGVFDEVMREVAHVRLRGMGDLARPGLFEAVRAAAGAASQAPAGASRSLPPR